MQNLPASWQERSLRNSGPCQDLMLSGSRTAEDVWQNRWWFMELDLLKNKTEQSITEQTDKAVSIKRMKVSSSLLCVSSSVSRLLSLRHTALRVNQLSLPSSFWLTESNSDNQQWARQRQLVCLKDQGRETPVYSMCKYIELNWTLIHYCICITA